LNNPGVHRGDDIHCAIQVWVRNSCFPCVRKASFDSRLTVPHHSYGQAHKNLLALAQIRHGMGITVKLSKIGPITHGFLLMSCDGFVPPQLQLDASSCCASMCAATVSQAWVVQYPAIGVSAATAGRQTIPHVLDSKW
jgi:hypothetical protein